MDYKKNIFCSTYLRKPHFKTKNFTPKGCGI